jgi:acyl-CoA thioester hydrolase
MWLEEIRPSRFVVAYELFDDGVVASRARSVCVPFDLAAGRPRRLSDAERTFLTPWLEPASARSERSEPRSREQRNTA